MTSLVCWFLQGHFCSIWNSSPYLQIPPRVHECFPSRVHWAARFNVIYDLAYLTDCGQPASEHSSESLQQVDEAEMSTKNEDKYNFMDLPVREVAEQLTRLDAVGFVFIKNWSSVFLGWLWEGFFFFLINFFLSYDNFFPQDLFVKVEPFHCLGCVWSQRDKKENRNLAPTVRATISQFNAVTNSVITSLLCTSPHLPSTSSPGLSPSLSSNFLYPSSAPSSPCILRTSPCHRARVIERWIAVAQVCITKYLEINKKFPSKNKMRTQERH